MNINDVFRQIKWAWQRVFRGWDDRVTWSIDWYLARTIPEWITQLRNNTHGVPHEIYISLGIDVESTTESDIDLASKLWDSVLEEISDGFTAAELIQDGVSLFDEDYLKLKEKFDRGFRLFHQHFFNLWD